MADRRIPDALAMRHLRTRSAPEAEREQVAEALRSQGRHTQALLLYDGRTAHPALQGELAQAGAAGQTFRLLTLRRLGLAVSEADLRACARAAEQAGRALEARLAYVAVSDTEAVRALGIRLPESLRPPPPPPPPAPPATTTTR